MADLIRVDCGQLESLASNVKRLGNALDAIESRIRGVRVDKESGAGVQIPLSAVRFISIDQTMRSGTTAECLKGLAANIGSLQHYADVLSANVRKAAGSFDDNERKLVSHFNNLLTHEGLMMGVAQALGYGSDPSGWSPAIHVAIQNIIQNAQILTDEDMTLVASDQQVMLFGPNGLIGTFTTVIGLSGITMTSTLFDGNHRYESEGHAGLMDGGFTYNDSILKPTDLFRRRYDKDGNPIKGDEKSGLGIGILSIGAKAGNSYSWYGDNISAQNGGLSADVNVGVGNAEAHASIQGGLGAYLSDGSGDLTVGLKGEVGVSISAANVEASMSYELIDNVSVGVGSEITVLEGEAGVETGIGMVDGELMAYAEASAEVNLIEAKAEGNLDLGLVEGKVGGGVSFGLGAHAKAGYNDGVISFDVGVAAGLGVSVNAEIDIGGTIDAIGDGIGTAIDTVGDGLGKLGEAIFG